VRNLFYTQAALPNKIIGQLRVWATAYSRTKKSGVSGKLDIRSQTKAFWENGYLCVENFFDPQLMDSFQTQIADHFTRNPEFVHQSEFLDKSKTDVIPWFPQREGAKIFDSVDSDLRLHQLTDSILGEGWSSLYCMVMYSRAGSQGQAWHQDCPPEDPRQFNLNRLVYTMDMDSGNGGEVVLVPGTHRGGAIPAGDGTEHLAHQVVLRPQKGSLLLLHGHLWHRVLPVKGNYRVSTNYRCCPAGVAESVTDTCVYRNMRYHFPSERIVEDRLA